LIILILEVSNLPYTMLRLIGLFFIIGLVAVNDYYRTRIMDRSKSKYSDFSIVLSIMLIGFLGQMAHTDFTKLYVYLTLPEIVQVQIKKRNNWLIGVVFFLFCILYFSKPTINMESVSNVMKSFIYTDFIPFWSIYLISYLYLNLLNNKRKIEGLNQELLEKIDQLQTYAEKVKELARFEERQRISQQLHDMLGHSLIALKLHLEVALNLVDKDAERSKEVLQKSEKIIDQSFLELKATVNELNSRPNTDDLFENFEEMALRFSLIEKIRVSYTIEKEVNDLDLQYKKMIIDVSREAITNSFKHGESTSVLIKVFKEKSMLKLLITNNGRIPKEIVASNGLIGMKKRVSDLNGNIIFIPGSEEGFRIEIAVPLKEK
jgi:signal transduction histidine kinase